MAITALYLIGSERLVSLVESDHINLDDSERLAIRKIAMATSVLGLRIDERVSSARDAELIFLPHSMSVAIP